MSELNYSTDDAKPASSIPLIDHTPKALLNDIFKDIEQLLTDKSIDSAASIYFHKGSTKSLKPGFNLVDYLKSINYVVYDYLITSNKQITPAEKKTLKAYFDGTTKLYDILTSVNFNVAENEFLSYIIGYNLRVIKAYYDRHNQVQE